MKETEKSPAGEADEDGSDRSSASSDISSPEGSDRGANTLQRLKDGKQDDAFGDEGIDAGVMKGSDKENESGPEGVAPGKVPDRSEEDRESSPNPEGNEAEGHPKEKEADSRNDASVRERKSSFTNGERMNEGNDQTEKKDTSTGEPKDDDAEERENIPKPLFPEPGDGSELLKEINLPSRRDIAEKMVSKHENMVERYMKELEELENIKDAGIEGMSEREREERDRINAKVAELKSRRTALKEENRTLRREFFSLMEKEEALKGHSKDVKMYSKYMDDLEWKLSTEAIDIETERRLLDELKDTIRKLRQITDGFTPDEINERLTAIQEKIGENLVTIEELHSRMLEEVERSNIHHERYRNTQRLKKERESRIGWLRRRIELHREMETFWKNQIDTAAKMDEEEAKRTVESIRDTLIRIFSERDKDKEETTSEKEHPTRKGTRPRKKLEMDKKRPSERTMASSEEPNEGVTSPVGEENSKADSSNNDGGDTGIEKSEESSRKDEPDDETRGKDDKDMNADKEAERGGEVV